MNHVMILPLAGNETLANHLAQQLGCHVGTLRQRTFPDGETYLRVESSVTDKTILLICSLDNPDSKILPLLFTAHTLRELGAQTIYLVTPYLAYMRQDKRFQPGEAVTAPLLAKLLSTYLDGLITIDPHLHRIKNLADIYSIPTIALHATQPIATWVKTHVEAPLLIGPDEESEQWVAAVADIIAAEYVILKKTRYGDREVAVTLPELKLDGYTPILLDDMISTGGTLLAIIPEIIARDFTNPICVAVHALFGDNTHKHLRAAGASQVVSCNTIAHPTNQIDLSPLIAESLQTHGWLTEHT